jgi:hypothetical protein
MTDRLSRGPVDAHQTNADIREEGFADLLVAIFDSGEHAGGIGAVCPDAIGECIYGRTSVRLALRFERFMAAT